jgi:exonuclease SbcC
MITIIRVLTTAKSRQLAANYESIMKYYKIFRELSKELKTLNKIEKEYNKNIQHNEKINIDIEKNRNDYNEEENNKYDEYDKYLELKEDLNTNNEKLNELNEKVNNMKLNLDKLNKSKEETKIIINKYDSNKKIYEDIDKIREKLENYRDSEKNIDKECKEFMGKISQINKELNKLETNIQIIQKNKEIITKNNKKKEILSIIKSATDNGGILDDILKGTILPSIETIVNNILSDVDTYKIKINYDSFIKITKIENNTEQESSGLMASGHEKSVLNIIFRLALSKLNSMISTNFFIIDEAFKNSDSNKKQKLKTLFEYLRNNYDWILIVTHDDYIKDNFDKEINIEHNNGTSLIKY